jgi:hypothetical protein
MPSSTTASRGARTAPSRPTACSTRRTPPTSAASIRRDREGESGSLAGDRSHDELHDALVVYGFLTAPEIEQWKVQLALLRTSGA